MNIVQRLRPSFPGDHHDRGTSKESLGIVWGGARRAAYNEEAFHYFLAVERSRSGRSKRPFLLLLVELKDDRRESAVIAAAVADKVFSALWVGLRDTDFIGWYRDGLVVGAVLVQPTEIGNGETIRQIRERVARTIVDRLPKEIGSRLRVRACRAPFESGVWTRP